MASIVDPEPDSNTSPSPELLHAAREWLWRHSSQPDGDRWLSTRPTLTAGNDPNHLDWAAENLLCDLAPWLVVPGDDEDDDCGHHSWAGLMTLIDEHWPDDIFPTRYEDDPKRDAGARIVSLMRWADQLRATDAILRAELIKSIEANNTWRERLMRVEALTYASDDGTEYEHAHGPHDGEPECPACWAESIRGVLGGDA